MWNSEDQDTSIEDCKGGSRAAATSKIERFVKTVNDWKPLTIITKHSTWDVTAGSR